MSRRGKPMYAGRTRDRRNSKEWEKFMQERNGPCRKFVLFKIGMEECARCRKTRKEHG
jgi:hypothetical protein